MQFGIRHVLWLVFAIGLALAFAERVRLERNWRRAELNYAVAKHRLDELEAKLANRNPNWKSEFQVRRSIHLPEPAFDVHKLESTEFTQLPNVSLKIAHYLKASYLFPRNPID